MNEWPKVLPPRSVEGLALAEISVLRARTAKKANSQAGLVQDLRRYLLQCPVCWLTLSTMMNWRLPEKAIHCRHFRSA